MKKLILTITIAMMSLVSVTAQEKEEQEGEGFSKGDVYVSGSVNYNSQSEDDFSDKRFTFVPTVGYFINDHIALEALLFISYRRVDSDSFFGDDNRDESFTFGGGLGSTYYFTPSNKFSFTTGANLIYSEFKFDRGDDFYRVTFQIEPGVSYFISKSFALKASIGALTYSHLKFNDLEDALVENTFALNLNLSDVNFGLTYKF